MALQHQPVLFENYVYGMGKEALLAEIAAAPCPEAPANDLLFCAQEPVSFLDRRWQMRFWFNNLGELQQVVLLSKRDGEKLETLKNAFMMLGWQPVFFESDQTVFDVVEAVKRDGSAKMEADLQKFEKDVIAEQDLTVYFLPKTVTDKALGQAVFWTQAVDQAPEEVVDARLAVNEDFFKFFFTAPQLSRKNALRYGEKIKR